MPSKKKKTSVKINHAPKLQDFRDREDKTARLYSTEDWKIVKERVGYLQNGLLSPDPRRFELNKVLWLEPRVFKLFPNLPKELRCLIWKLSLPKPRILSLKNKSISNYPCRCPSACEIDVADRRQLSQPQVVLSCKEARDVFQANYTTFKVKKNLMHAHHEVYFPPKGFFNPKRDILIVKPPQESTMSPEADRWTYLDLLDLSLVQNVVISFCHRNWNWKLDASVSSDSPERDNLDCNIWQTARMFPALKALTVLLVDKTYDRRRRPPSGSEEDTESIMFDIGADMLEMAAEYRDGQPSDRRHHVQHYLDVSSEIKLEFEKIKHKKGEFGDLSRVRFNVALRAILEGTSLLPRGTLWIPLDRTTPKYYGVCYYTERQTRDDFEDSFGSTSLHRLYFADLGCWARWHLDGYFLKPVGTG